VIKQTLSLAVGSLSSGQNRQKTVWRSAFCVYSALKIQCHIVKNTPLQTALSAILPTE